MPWTNNFKLGLMQIADNELDFEAYELEDEDEVLDWAEREIGGKNEVLFNNEVEHLN